MRYTTSFASPNTTCDWIERNPGFVPVIDNNAIVIALCDNKEIAERIASLLNKETLHTQTLKVLEEYRDNLAVAFGQYHAEWTGATLTAVVGLIEQIKSGQLSPKS